MNPNDPGHDKVVHVYDDIEEEDNHLPNWWLAILFGSIAFAFGYWFVYHTADLRPTPNEAFRERVAAIVAARASADAIAPEAIVALTSDAEAMAAGAEVYRTTCAACHGLEGQGLIGPNLTDRYWLHGAGPADILRVIRDGVPAKGMPAWGGMLGSERSVRAAAFVLSLRGKNLEGKEPQGVPVD